MVAASQRPASVQLETEPEPADPRFAEEFTFRWIHAAQEPNPFASRVADQYSNLSLATLQKLAAGQTLLLAHPEQPEAGVGNLRMGWWTDETSARIRPVLEFLPLDSLPKATGFAQWACLRFPCLDTALGEFSGPFRLYQLRHWKQECSPEPVLSPADPSLYQAVVDNWEEGVREILQDRKIICQPGEIRSLRETALGVAMENSGDFGAASSLRSGCHRLFRDDLGFRTEVEPRESWVPRAQRIAAMLRQAGAVDYSPLLGACRRGDLPAVKAMLDRGFPPNFAVYHHTSALLEAVDAKHPAIVQVLLEHGADPNQPRWLPTALEQGRGYPLAGALDEPEILTLLLDAAADPSRCDASGRPVAFAGGYGSAACAAMVFGRISFETLRDRTGGHGLHLLNAGNLGHCRAFIPRQLVDQRDHWGTTPLIGAIAAGDAAKVDLLLELGASADARGMLGFICPLTHPGLSRFSPCLLTPVQVALLFGEEKILLRLLELGVECSSIGYSLSSEPLLDREVAPRLLERIREDCGLWDFTVEPDLDAPFEDLLYSNIMPPADARELQKLPYLITRHPAALERYAEVLDSFDIRDCVGERHEALIAAWNAAQTQGRIASQPGQSMPIKS